MNDDCPYCEFKDGMNIEHECLEQRAKEKINRIADECGQLEEEVAHQKNLKEAFEKHSWELSERNNAVIDKLEAENLRLRKIIGKILSQAYQAPIDHACVRCIPNGQSVQEGFLCGIHEGRQALSDQGAEEKKND